MDGFQKRTASKKQSIRRAAFELMEQYGIDRISVGEIARRAGVSHVTIYKYFGSKAGLVRDILQTRFAAQLDRLHGILHSDRSFPEKLEAVLMDKVQAVSPFSEEMSRQALASDPELREYFEAAMQNDMPQLYLAIIEDGIESGWIDPQLPRETALVFLYLIRAGALADPQSWAQFHATEKNLRDFQDLIFYGLVGKRGRRDRDET